ILTITTNDLGDTGSGGPLVASDTVAIAVDAVNDAPVNTVPGAQTVNEDTSLAISGISINDVDVNEGNGVLQVTLAVTSGTLSLDTTTGLSFSSGDGSGDDTMTFSGLMADVNAALTSLSYLGDSDVNG